jgi:hypothetical protein
MDVGCYPFQHIIHYRSLKMILLAFVFFVWVTRRLNYTQVFEVLYFSLGLRMNCLTCRPFCIMNL